MMNNMTLTHADITALASEMAPMVAPMMNNMTLTHADITALASEMAPMVARLLADMPQGNQPVSAAPLDEVERVKQQALILAQQGKRAESLELMNSLYPRRRTSHA